MTSRIPSDQELMRAARSGDQAAWEGLHSRYCGYVLRTARYRLLDPDDAQDVAQIVWMQVCERIADGTQIDSLRSMLQTVAIRRCIEVIRRRYRTRSRISYSMDETGPSSASAGDSGAARMAARDPGILDSLVAQEEQDQIEQAIGQLPLHYQAVVRSRVYKTLSCRETAQALVRSGLIDDTGNIEKRAENYYYRALSHLRSTLEPGLMAQ